MEDSANFYVVCDNKKCFVEAVKNCTQCEEAGCWVVECPKCKQVVGIFDSPYQFMKSEEPECPNLKCGMKFYASLPSWGQISASSIEKIYGKGAESEATTKEEAAEEANTLYFD